MTVKWHNSIPSLTAAYHCTFFILLLAIPSQAALSHGQLHIQIEQLSHLIDKTPNQVELYLKRGELYRLHQDINATLADFTHAAKIAPKQAITNLFLSRAYLDNKQYQLAETTISRFLSAQPQHAMGLIIRARAFTALNHHLKAAADYTQALNLMEPPQPAYYLERAKVLQKQGASYFNQAITGLDEGIKKLGPLVVLQLEAIHLLEKQHRYKEALQRVDTLISQTQRKEKWFLMRGKLLILSTQYTEAKEAFILGLEAIKQLPTVRRRTRATQQIKIELESALDQLTHIQK